MFDAAIDLKGRLESRAMEFCEKWDLQDNCDWFVPANTNVEELEANLAKEAKTEEAAVGILRALQNAIDAVPSPLMRRTEQLYNSIGAENYGKAAIHYIETIGFGLYPVDATEFVRTLNEAIGARAPG